MAKFLLILSVMFLGGCYNVSKTETQEMNKKLDWESRRGNDNAYIRHADPSPMPMKSGKKGAGFHSPDRLM